jgi:hypothetical protein
MLGEPQPLPIQPFPLFQQMGQPARFDDWGSSVLNLEDNRGAGALTFLWHLRALLTGNEDDNFIPGSVYFPLVTGQPNGNPPTDIADADNSISYPPPSPAKGAWIGIRKVKNPPNGPTQLVLDLYDGSGKSASIPLASTDGGLHRPSISTDEWNRLTGLLSSIPLTENKEITITSDGPAQRRVSLFDEEVSDQVFGGLHAELIVTAPGQQEFPVNYAVTLLGPQGANANANAEGVTLTLPPSGNGTQQLCDVAAWLLKSQPPQNAVGKNITDALSIFVKSLAMPGGPKPKDATALLTAVAGEQVKIGPLTISFGGSTVTADFVFSNLALGDNDNIDVRVGKMEVGTTLDLSPVSPKKFHLSFLDLRLAKPAGTKSTGLIASLLPDLTQAPGFSLKVQWPEKPLVDGGGKIPIQQTIGPLDIIALLINVTSGSDDSSGSVKLGIDLSFKLGPIIVSVYELSIKITFDGPSFEPSLHGLGVSMDTSVVRLAGMFGEVERPGGGSDYVGGAVVSVVDLFELSAIGGYTQLANGEASLFIFASLVAPLGGPPFFFVTGIAGGFGFNRTLPPPGLLSENPFLKVMNDGIDLTNGTEAALQELSTYFDAVPDTYWVAGGIQFVSFGFINGKVIVAVQFGHSFALSVLGMASFAIKPLVYFEIAIEVSVNEEGFLLKAGVSPASYLIHPDVFSLRGDFGLGVWHDGDFMLSIGGFHPYFKAPQRYLDLNLNRVAVKASLFGWIRLSVECFFACTPQALMSGASISLAAEFEGVGAGLDIYVDVLITWDPFFLLARMGVTVWFEFLGRHEISVALSIWTPPFGGLAVIDLALVSFEIEFGQQKDNIPPPQMWEFLTHQLNVPAAEENQFQVAKVSAFNSDEAAGLFRVDILEGRASKDKQSDTSSKQEGLEKAIPVNSEFGFIVRTKLPVSTNNPGLSIADGTVTLTGQVDIPLCELSGLKTDFTVKAMKIKSAEPAAVGDFFPQAQFGEPLRTAQADDLGGRQAISTIETDQPVVALTEGIEFHYKGILHPPDALLPSSLEGGDTELSEGAERYPLPLEWPFTIPQTVRNPKPRLRFAAQHTPLVVKPRIPVIPRRQAALNAIRSKKLDPLHVTLRSGQFHRDEGVLRLRGQTLAQTPPNVPVMTPLRSPARPPEMHGITLRVVRPHAAAPVKRSRISIPRIRAVVTKRRLTPVAGVRDRFQSEPLTLGPGKVAQFELSGIGPRRSVIANTGRHIVRAICLGIYEEFIGDLYIGPDQRTALPARSAYLILIGEGHDAAVATGASAVAQENLGIEHDTSLLAVGARIFAGHGCVVRAMSPLSEPITLLDTMSGYELFQSGCLFRVHFAVPRVGWTLIIHVRSIVPDPGSAVDQVRWLSQGATLSDLHIVIGAGRVAFVMAVEAQGRWAIDIDLGKNWRLAGVAVCHGSTAELSATLRSQPEWDFVDDRLEPQAASVSSLVTLEIAP